jgi:uncharacterized protein YbjT (DUF2867 family)
MANKTALVIGATGLVGEQCLQQLLEHKAYDKVIAVTRKKLSVQHSKLQNVVMDFDKPESVKDSLKCDDVYCAIGTTIKTAGSQEAFYKVDYEYPLRLAELCLQNGAKRFILVSSLGADATSGIFYSRTKGELEEALKKLNFEALLIFRPSILLGNRKEQRAGEAVGRFVAEKFSFLFAGPLKQYRGTPADLLARVMIKTGTSGFKGTRVLENNDIFTESV